MKKIIIMLAGMILLFSVNGFACVGKTLIIGATSTPQDKLIAQMMAVIINERTGTTVNVEYYDDRSALYEAVKKKEVNIFSENTGYALQVLQMEASGNTDAIYSTVKQQYKDQLQLIMLKPFGASQAVPEEGPYLDVPIVDAGILIDYPALPRVLNKLSGIMQEKSYAKLLASVESGDKPNQVARDFLKKKRII